LLPDELAALRQVHAHEFGALREPPTRPAAEGDPARPENEPRRRTDSSGRRVDSKREGGSRLPIQKKRRFPVNTSTGWAIALVGRSAI